jgi:polyhydroxyalkanoate synthesis regulator phasin
VPRLPGSEEGGPSEALRNAIERTFEATATSAGEAGSRARELLDEVVRRGQVARDDATRRIDRARGDATRRLEGARDETTRRLEGARDDATRRIEAELRALGERLEKLESAVRGSGIGRKP